MNNFQNCSSIHPDYCNLVSLLSSNIFHSSHIKVWGVFIASNHYQENSEYAAVNITMEITPVLGYDAMLSGRNLLVFLR
jgi:hypothetical protein